MQQFYRSHTLNLTILNTSQIYNIIVSIIQNIYIFLYQAIIMLTSSLQITSILGLSLLYTIIETKLAILSNFITMIKTKITS